mmetsp:Transcript_90698/g.174626  ORF Transcript_90698/g.174626 Transcript_90698/m.174626 type:complete len:132 (-) Transcript_90698:391-786(-)
MLSETFIATCENTFFGPFAVSYGDARQGTPVTFRDSPIDISSGHAKGASSVPGALATAEGCNSISTVWLSQLAVAAAVAAAAAAAAACDFSQSWKRQNKTLDVDLKFNASSFPLPFQCVLDVGWLLTALAL